MPQHFTDGFKRDTMRKRDLGGVGMASAVKDELPFNSANGGNTFQCPVEFVVAVHRQQFSFRGHIPVLVEDEQRDVEQRHFIVDFRLLAGGLDPYLTVLGHFQILRRQAAHVPVRDTRVAGEEEQVADMVEFRVVQGCGHQPL